MSDGRRFYTFIVFPMNVDIKQYNKRIYFLSKYLSKDGSAIDSRNDVSWNALAWRH
jgi:hypothetical protein